MIVATSAVAAASAAAAACHANFRVANVTVDENRVEIAEDDVERSFSRTQYAHASHLTRLTPYTSRVIQDALCDECC